MEHSRIGSSQGEHCPQNRSNTGCPAERKSHAKNKRTKRTAGFQSANVKAFLAIKKWNLEEVHHVESKDNDKHSTNPSQPISVFREVCSAKSKDRTKYHKNRTETKHVQKSIKKYFPSDHFGSVWIIKVANRDTADKPQITGYKRQGTGREKREHSGQK